MIRNAIGVLVVHVVIGPLQPSERVITEQLVNLALDLAELRPGRYRRRSVITAMNGRNRLISTTDTISALASSSVQTCPDTGNAVADGDAVGDSSTEGDPDPEGSGDEDGGEEEGDSGDDVVPGDSVEGSVGNVSAKAVDDDQDTKPKGGASTNSTPNRTAPTTPTEPRRTRDPDRFGNSRPRSSLRLPVRDPCGCSRGGLVRFHTEPRIRLRRGRAWPPPWWPPSSRRSAAAEQARG